MVSNDQSFPRGGKKPKLFVTEKKKFDFLGHSDKIGKKKRYKPKVIQQADDAELEYLSDASSDVGDKIKAISAEMLSNKTIQEGMILLGRIMKVTDTKITVSLPGHLKGSVMANQISLPYTKLLQSYVNDEINDVEKMDEIYKNGEYVSVKVTSAVLNDAGKIFINFSMMPQDVNSGITCNTIQEGSILRGAVESVEDHGFVIDLGISKCRAFLPLKHSDVNIKLVAGQVIWCVVKKCEKNSNSSIVTVTNKINALNSTRIHGEKVQNYSVHDLKPGMAVDFHANKPLKDGVEGIILSDTMAYVHVSQISQKIKVGHTVKAYLLYTMPVSKLPFFTIREIFGKPNQDMNEEAPFKVGTLMEDAKVFKVIERSVLFKFEDSVAIVPKGLSKVGNMSSEDYRETYKKGSSHNIRIINYHPSDYAYICSDKQDVLEKKYFSIGDLSIGDVVEAKVDKILENGVLVRLDDVIGFIPNIHCSDIGLSASKNVKKSNLILNKFKTGQKVPARVLKVDVQRNQLHLTTKKALLSPDVEILSDYGKAIVGSMYKGTIEHFLQHGAIVTFFGDVQAFVHISEMSSERIYNIQAAFNLGQIVNCYVLFVDAENKKMKCSFRSPPVEEAEEKKTKKKDKINYVHNEFVSSNENESTEDNQDNKKKKKKNKLSTSDNDETESSKESLKKKKDKLNNSDKKGSKKNKNKLSTSDTEETESFKENSKKRKLANENEPSSDNKKNKKSKTNDVTIENEQLDKSKKKNKRKDISTEATATDSNENSMKESKKKKRGDSTKSEETDKKSIEKLNVEEQKTKEFSSMKNFWDLDAGSVSKNFSAAKSDSSSSESEEEVVDKAKKKKKKLTVAEKAEKIRMEEEKLRDIERQLMDSESQPQSSDQFDRLLLADPNNSELWIAYMAFHLQSAEIDRARAVAKKALSIISFREEQEKLNVWLALLNLENRFGTKESLTSTLQQALNMNESYKVHSKMLDMFVETSKVSELIGLVDTMMAKYRQMPEAYAAAGQACYNMNLVDKGRAVMQKALSRLENKKHIPVIVKFAQMENNYGDSERAETLFEQIIGCAPQRVDVWCVYIDMLMKSGKIENTRLLFERAVAYKMPLKKMKILFKKWMEMEEKYGTKSDVEKVRGIAKNYVEGVK